MYKLKSFHPIFQLLESFSKFCRLCHEKGFSIVLDAVFNHTGRNFFAFRDIQEHGKESQFTGMYKNISLYNFVDNHDVNRAGSSLSAPDRHLPLLYALLFTIPGIPSIYYGSEFGIKGKRNENGDYELRPSLPPFTPCLPEYLQQNFDTNFLPSLIARYASIHLEHTALQSGDFSLALTRSRQLAFWRTNSEEQILVILNSDFEAAHIEIESIPFGSYRDLLTGKHYHSDNFRGLELAPCSVIVLKKN